LLFHNNSGYANAPECYVFTYSACIASYTTLAGVCNDYRLFSARYELYTVDKLQSGGQLSSYIPCFPNCLHTKYASQCLTGSENF